MRVWRLWTSFVAILSSILACTLMEAPDETRFLSSELTPARTDGWVSYTEQDVRIGAPAGSWSQIPFTIGDATNQWNDWLERDPSVANVYRDLMRFIVVDSYVLLLMKNDGTAWLQATREPIDIDFDSTLRARQQQLVDQGTPPYHQRSIALSAGDAVRWEVSTSPAGSQIVDHQFHYLINVGDWMYQLVFNAQESDFNSYTPVFEAMALSFWISQ